MVRQFIQYKETLQLQMGSECCCVCEGGMWQKMGRPNRILGPKIFNPWPLTTGPVTGQHFHHSPLQELSSQEQGGRNKILQQLHTFYRCTLSRKNKPESPQKTRACRTAGFRYTICMCRYIRIRRDKQRFILFLVQCVIRLVISLSVRTTSFLCTHCTHCTVHTVSHLLC